MPMIVNAEQIADKVLNDLKGPWRSMIRCDTPSGDFDIINQCISSYHPEKVIFAEGDSWFDKFTPIPNPRTNLLQEIRLPFSSVVVDVSTIGDEASDMVSGWQSWRTQAIFDMYGFDAILLSAGGNDIKNLFANKILSLDAKQLKSLDVKSWSKTSEYTDFFTEVASNIKKFVGFRNAAGNKQTLKAPIFLHGYDYFQPRPAKAPVFSGGSLGLGPWLYPILKARGLTDKQMRAAADAVVDELNNILAAEIAPLDNVFVIDSRGILKPAAATTTGEDADWLDEIHPNGGGFEKLARCCWNKPLAQSLGWKPAKGDLVAACARSS